MRCENSASACFSNCIFTYIHQGCILRVVFKVACQYQPQASVGHFVTLLSVKGFNYVFFFLHFSNFAMLFAKHRYGASVLEGVFVGLDPGISSPLSVPFVCAGPVCPCGGMCMTYHVKWRFPKTVLFPNHVIWIRVILTPILRIIASQGEIANGPECPESVANFGRNKGQHGNIGGRTGCQTSTWAFN